MAILSLLRLLHFVGFGLLATSTAGGWILFRRYRRLGDRRSQAVLLSGARAVGLLSPAGIGVMLLTGIGQMHFYGFGLFSEAWLSLKLLIFLIAATAGIVFSVRARTRTHLVSQLADGTAAAGAELEVARLDRQLQIFYQLQTTLLIVILLLAVMKPLR